METKIYNHNLHWRHQFLIRTTFTKQGWLMIPKVAVERSLDQGWMRSRRRCKRWRWKLNPIIGRLDWRYSSLIWWGQIELAKLNGSMIKYEISIVSLLHKNEVSIPCTQEISRDLRDFNCMPCTLTTWRWRRTTPATRWTSVRRQWRLPRQVPFYNFKTDSWALFLGNEYSRFQKLPKALKIIFDRAIIFRSELKRERTRLPSWMRRRSSLRLSSTSQLKSLDTSHFRWKPLKGGFSHSKKTSNQALFEFVSDTDPNNHGPKPGWTPTSGAVLNPDQFQILHNL